MADGADGGGENSLEQACLAMGTGPAPPARPDWGVLRRRWPHTPAQAGGILNRTRAMLNGNYKQKALFNGKELTNSNSDIGQMLWPFLAWGVLLIVVYAISYQAGPQKQTNLIRPTCPKTLPRPSACARYTTNRDSDAGHGWLRWFRRRIAGICIPCTHAPPPLIAHPCAGSSWMWLQAVTVMQSGLVALKLAHRSVEQASRVVYYATQTSLSDVVCVWEGGGGEAGMRAAMAVGAPAVPRSDAQRWAALQAIREAAERAS